MLSICFFKKNTYKMYCIAHLHATKGTRLLLHLHMSNLLDGTDEEAVERVLLAKKGEQGGRGARRLQMRSYCWACAGGHVSMCTVKLRNVALFL